jgi:hypothetical protein
MVVLLFHENFNVCHTDTREFCYKLGNVLSETALTCMNVAYPQMIILEIEQNKNNHHYSENKTGQRSTK